MKTMSYETMVATPRTGGRAGTAVASPAPDLDVLFAPRTDGYLGTDSAVSVRLGSDRVVWLFGDTLTGSVEGGQRIVTGTSHNSAALQFLGSGIVPWAFSAASHAGQDFLCSANWLERSKDREAFTQ